LLITGSPSKTTKLPLSLLPPPFGLDGLFKINNLWGRYDECIPNFRELYREDGTVLNCTLKGKERHYILSISGIDNREKAKEISGEWLYCESSVIINSCKYLEQYFVYFTLNFTCYYQNNDYLGQVVDVKNYGGGDILQIINQKKEYLVLFTCDFINSIDFKEKTITLVGSCAL